jgi:hypothetical protein
MPNFNTHWLVAMNCTINGGLPTFIGDGFIKYKDITREFKNKLDAEIKNISKKDTLDAFFKTGLDDLLKTYNDNLTGIPTEATKSESPEKLKKTYNEITCFSAYMLGACGPDFWTVTSPPKNPKLNPVPDTASQHFDLGHYNRTHQQFQVAIERWNKMEKDSSKKFQIQVEQAYFYGMATHIAADCVIHQLVNVSAGAYNLLEEKWYCEQTKNPKLWNTHNKVEHYWDSYVRYRYLGDLKNIFPGQAGVANNGMITLGFPTIETIISEQLPEKSDIRDEFIKKLKDEKNKSKIELPFILPRIFCDRMNALHSDLEPFIHKIVVDKDTGAYPGKIKEDKTLEGIVFRKAIEEAKSFQMEAGPDNKNYSEGKKLDYFKTVSNTKTTSITGSFEATCFNYLNYYVCPNLERLRLFGYDKFYHTNALEPFIDSARKAAVEFIGFLSDGIGDKKAGIKPKPIGLLGKFWNLDTGLGLEVKSISSHTPHEVITELNFVHINNNTVTKSVTYEKNENYLSSIKATKKPYPETTGITAFNTESALSKAYIEHITSLKDTDDNTYTDRLLLNPRVSTPYPACNIDGFFMDHKETSTQPMLVESARLKPVNDFQVHDIKHRLNFMMTVPVADFSHRGKYDELGFELRSDGQKTLKEMKPATDTETKKWLKTSKAIERLKASAGVKSNPGSFERTDVGICIFNSRLLLNLEQSKELKQKSAKTKSSNVIEFDKNEALYSRNYSIGTGRKNVLHPTSFDAFGHFGTAFDATTDLAKYVAISPTEQVFFSIYLITKTHNAWYDMLSKENVTKDQLEKLIRIDSLGFVKIVIFYELTKNGAAKLSECYVDGLRVDVIQG